MHDVHLPLTNLLSPTTHSFNNIRDPPDILAFGDAVTRDLGVGTRSSGRGWMRAMPLLVAATSLLQLLLLLLRRSLVAGLQRGDCNSLLGI